MDNEVLTKHFKAIGVRIKFRSLEAPSSWRRSSELPLFTLDIATDRRGEFFDIARGPDAPEFELLQSKPKERHLLLYARDGQRFLCGHDERHWFVAAIGKPVSTIRAAKQALLPQEIWDQIKNLPPEEVDKRRNAVFLRQGEWFFVPANHEVPEAAVAIRNEPLQRSLENNSHICEEIYRTGGELVYIVGGAVLSEKKYRDRLKQRINYRYRPYQTMIQNPIVYARGNVRHEDHATIRLRGWHRVFINAEITTTNVTFLD